ncbi:alpha/beta fold hydrolase [Neopusillimonas aromaticivorans]|uniref:alpha/beta fold hydrolase n=1 Tax=Neopusillimonas aromaticivorans TaxID=2979868 RepID=UPI002592CDCF|nr:alpha/beta hydrolase [Neopusillimonas aromaticivorans]NLZ11551.1 alpha/beta hydrolase [Alcaligenaceae bacterium]WJJ92552.1 alpha/beta hydrolase [Neopusillimonas aromaticivorans]
MQDLIIPSSPPLAITVAGQGPLVILIHGLGGDRTTWSEQLTALQDRYTAVSVDLRGYGNSGDPSGPLDFKRDFCADLVAVMDYFKVPRAHLVGLSMGGRVARTTALQVPDRIASLTLANTSPGFDHLEPAQLDAFVQARSAVIKDHQLPADFGYQQALGMMAPGTPENTLQIMAKAVNRLRVGNYLNTLQASTLQDRGDRLEDLACPVHLITSDLDTVYPASITLAMQARIPNATLTRITGAGHISNLEQPEAFNQALTHFLDTLPREADAQRAA